MIETDTICERDGTVRHTIAFAETPHDSQYDTVVIEHPRDGQRLDSYCYNDGDVGFSQQFQQRSLSFHPISLHGGGDDGGGLAGCVPVKSNPHQATTTDMTQIPYDLTVALHHLGLTTVPNGAWWQ